MRRFQRVYSLILHSSILNEWEKIWEISFSSSLDEQTIKSAIIRVILYIVLFWILAGHRTRGAEETYKSRTNAVAATRETWKLLFPSRHGNWRA